MANRDCDYIIIEKRCGGLEHISDFIQERCLDARLSFKRTWELMLVVDEICSSIIIHSQNKEAELQIFWKNQETFVEVEILDRDIPFNPLIPPSDEDDCPELGAMGAYLIEKMVDKAFYKRCNGSNKIFLIKNRCKKNKNKHHSPG